MSQVTLALNPGVSVVLEGLDGTGKSTQLSMLKSALDPGTVVFAHMPSGFTQFTRRVYEPLARLLPVGDLLRRYSFPRRAFGRHMSRKRLATRGQFLGGQHRKRDGH